MTLSNLSLHQVVMPESETSGFQRQLLKKSRRKCNEEGITLLIINAFQRRNISKMTRMNSPTSRNSSRSSSQNLSLMTSKAANMREVLMWQADLQDPNILKYQRMMMSAPETFSQSLESSFRMPTLPRKLVELRNTSQLLTKNKRSQSRKNIRGDMMTIIKTQTI